MCDTRSAVQCKLVLFSFTLNLFKNLELFSVAYLKQKQNAN